MTFRRSLSLPAALVAAALGAVTLAACDEGPAENAGEKVDEAVKDAERGVKDSTD